MPNNIEYATLGQQIEKLRSQNLIIHDEEAAKKALSIFGYSNLIKSYRTPYMHIVNGKKIYRSGITFEQIESLYFLDKNLRNAVMASMLDLEEHIKEISADIIASAFGTHPDDYLNFRNYQNRRKRQERFTLKGILASLRKTLDTDKNPIHHYQQEHGIVPPWILFKSVYFTTINNFIDQFKIPQKDAMIKRLYKTAQLNLSQESWRKLLMDTLFICQEYRNIAAHGGRTYNYICSTKLRTQEIFGSNSEGIEGIPSGFSQLLFLLDLFEYTGPVSNLHSTLNRQVNRHCHLYPQDVTYLGQILNMDIVQKHYVYVSATSGKYHSDPHCSGMRMAQKVELEAAQSKGFIPCKRCT